MKQAILVKRRYEIATMPQIPQCHSCQYYAHHYALVCAPHPSGPTGETCSDYDPDPNLKNRQFRDFLGLGEPVDFQDAIANPYSDDPEENWAPAGWEVRRWGTAAGGLSGFASQH